MRFGWDPEKARTNLIKHGLPFDLAEAAFGDPFQLVWHDDGDHDEDRWQCIASLPRGAILAIIFTERTSNNGETIIRIISLRHATRDEQRRYRTTA
ncbi:MAG: BrnT family toxin [Thermomicrobiales bacterium]